MKRIARSVLLAGLTALALGACTSLGMQGSKERTSSTADSESSGGPDYTGITGTAVGASGAAGTTASGTTEQAGQAGPTNSTVANIEVIPRQAADVATGADTVAGAASGVGGVTASSAASDRVYRVTLRTDDGNVRTITQESAPSFSVGDRVRLSGEAIER